MAPTAHLQWRPFRSVVQRFDEDGSGTISPTEFQRSLRAAQEELEAKQRCAFPALDISEGEMMALFKAYDTDGSGDISFDEVGRFVSMYVASSIFGSVLRLVRRWLLAPCGQWVIWLVRRLSVVRSVVEFALF